jgi:hypothetical protein
MADMSQCWSEVNRGSISADNDLGDFELMFYFLAISCIFCLWATFGMIADERKGDVARLKQTLAEPADPPKDSPQTVQSH